MTFTVKENYTYGDFLLSPKYSEIRSRSKVNTSTILGQNHYKHGIIIANMKSLMNFEIASKIIESGGLAILHRFNSIEEQLEDVRKLYSKYGNNNFAVSVGVKNIDKENIDLFDQEGIKIICIDIAHGDSIQCVEMIKYIKEKYSSMIVIAGNVATGSGAERLWSAGADIVKCGVGSGSICLTRTETGNGSGQMSVLMDIAKTKEKMLQQNSNRKLYLIADGGVTSAGDLCKAFCFADAVMVGNLFGGCLETSGNIIEKDGKKYKEYSGSSTHKTDHVEGVKAIVEIKSSYDSVLKNLLQGLKSGMSYQGAKTLDVLRESPAFLRISNATANESGAHHVTIIKE